MTTLFLKASHHSSPDSRGRCCWSSWQLSSRPRQLSQHLPRSQHQLQVASSPDTATQALLCPHLLGAQRLCL